MTNWNQVNNLRYADVTTLMAVSAAAAAAAKSLQLRLTLCDPIDGSPPGSPVPGILRKCLIKEPGLKWQL